MAENDRHEDAAQDAAVEEQAPAPEEDQTVERVELSYPEYEELKTLARERDQYLKRLQRAVADYQNLQKRIDRFRETAYHDALRSLGEAILPVADSLSRALEAAEQTEGGETIAAGLRLVEKEFYGALEKLNIRPIQAVGQPFDPHYHEAVMQEPTDEFPPNTVVRELKKGFALDEQVLRPSQVIVAGPGEQPDEDQGRAEVDS